MANPLQNFVAKSLLTPITAAWLNLQDAFVNTLFQSATTAAQARSAIGAAASGANTDITSISAVVNTSALTNTGTSIKTGIISVAVGSSQNNWAPTGFATAQVVFVAPSANGWHITGMAGGANGRVITIINTGSFDLTLDNQSGSSTASNQFLLSGLENHYMPPGSSITLLYENLSNLWRQVSSTASETQNGSFTITLTGFTASITGTAIYQITGSVATLFLPIMTGTSNATTMTGTGLPAAITPSATAHSCIVIVEDNGSTKAAQGNVASNGVISFYSDTAGTAFTNSGTKGLPISATLIYNLN